MKQKNEGKSANNNTSEELNANGSPAKLNRTFRGPACVLFRVTASSFPLFRIAMAVVEVDVAAPGVGLLVAHALIGRGIKAAATRSSWLR